MGKQKQKRVVRRVLAQVEIDPVGSRTYNTPYVLMIIAVATSQRRNKKSGETE